MKVTPDGRNSCFQVGVNRYCDRVYFGGRFVMQAPTVRTLWYFREPPGDRENCIGFRACRSLV